MKTTICLILLPLAVWGQEFPFEFDPQGIPLSINGWEPQCPWAPGMSESTPAFCDLDADGDLDFFSGDFQDSIRYYINQGSATQPDYLFITSAYASLYCLSGSSSSFDFGDLDNDADFDICMGQGAGAVYWNTGSMSAPEFYPTPDTLRSTQGSLMVATDPELSDIDADGDLDLIAGHYEGTIYLYRNVGTVDSMSFLFETGQWLGIDVGTYASPTFCDLDNDGDLDLFVGTGSGRVRYYRNDGTPQQYNFTPVSSYWLSLDVGDYASPEFCDINGDGDLDLFVGREPNLASPTIGDINFLENIGTPTAPSFQLVTANYLTLDLGYDIRQQLVDIDADGDLDLFAGVEDNIRFLDNVGNPQEPFFMLESTAYSGISQESINPYFCDIDGDGDYDLFAGEGVIPGPPGLHLYLNHGTPQQAQFSLYSSNFVPGDYFVLIVPTLADIDADGDYDLFITDDDQYGTRDIYYYQNNGTFTWPDFQFVTYNWQAIFIYAPYRRQLRFHDIDGDGDLDLFFFNNWNESGGSNLRYYQNVGTAQAPQMQLVTPTYCPMQVLEPCAEFCDIDADGNTDLFAGDLYGGILFFHGLADTSGWVMPPMQRHPRAGLELALGPNPANPSTVISFNLPYAQQIDLAVYNLLGARVATLVSGFTLPGRYAVPWDGTGNASGIYFVRLRAGKERVVEKIEMLK